MDYCERRTLKELVTICGVPYKVVECEDNFSADSVHFGEVDFKHAEIKINKDMAESVKSETLCHEIIHAILVHIGRADLSSDETFVQALGNAVNQTFIPKGGI